MSVFSNEVRTQPAKLLEMLKIFEGENYSTIRAGAELLRKAKTIVFSGMGTSYYAPGCVLPELRKVKPAFVVEASEMEYCVDDLVGKEDALVLISQSGESVELINVIRKAKGNVSILIITNDSESTLAKNGDVVILLHAGEETSITNKTFTNTMAVLYLLCDYVTGKNAAETVDELKASAVEMEEIIRNRQDEIRKVADYMAPADAIHFIGRNGASMTIANQSALIFMEGAACNARAFSSNAFRHGPIEICSEKHRVIVYHCTDDEDEIMRNLVNQMSCHGSHVCVVSNEPNKNALNFPLKAGNSRGFSMVAAVFMECVLIVVAGLRGRVAGEFLITHKICITE